MENAEIAVAGAVEGEHLWIFFSQTLSTRTYSIPKHRSFHLMEIIKKFFLLYKYNYIQGRSMENAEMAITGTVDGEHLWIFVSQSLSTHTYSKAKHRGVHLLEIIKKNFCLINPLIYRGAVWRMQKSPLLELWRVNTSVFSSYNLFPHVLTPQQSTEVFTSLK